MVILVVEDEIPIREFEVTYLKEAGYSTLEAGSGQAALELFSENKPNLVILDLNLPGMSGIEVCHAIRETSTLPILMVTAHNSDDDELKGFGAGADDYIRKPFNPNILVKRVGALLHRQKIRQLHFGNLTITPSTMSVMKDGKPIALTTIQFNLLLTLASQPNVVFSRAQLVDRVYADPSAHVVYDRTIDAHIKALRQQIEPDPHRPHYIETVFGAGYRFQGEHKS